MAHPVAQQIVEQAIAMHKAAAMYEVNLCIYCECAAGPDPTNDHMRFTHTVCLTPVGSHLHISWPGMAFRVLHSDAAAYQEVINYAISSWWDSVTVAEEDEYPAVDQMDHAVGRIYLKREGTVIESHKNFSMRDSDAAEQVINDYMAPLRHLAPPLEASNGDHLCSVCSCQFTEQQQQQQQQQQQRWKQHWNQLFQLQMQQFCCKFSAAVEPDHVVLLN
jgi:hypothetical protein